MIFFLYFPLFLVWKMNIKTPLKKKLSCNTTKSSATNWKRMSVYTNEIACQLYTEHKLALLVFIEQKILICPWKSPKIDRKSNNKYVLYIDAWAAMPLLSTAIQLSLKVLKPLIIGISETL